MRSRLIIFTRYPQPGYTKTRLIPAIGAEAAAHLQRLMTEHTVAQVRPLLRQTDFEIEIRYTGTTREVMQQWLGERLMYQDQGAGDLGERLLRAFTAAFAGACDRVLAIGVDCPELGSAEIQEALQQLKENDLVMGPANDGGYYLIGLRGNQPSLFKNIVWGSETVLARTLKTAEQLNLSWHKLRLLADVDRPEDLAIWEQAQKGFLQAVELREPLSEKPCGARVPKISVIIPTFNEAPQISNTIASVTDNAVEVIVVDGGSTDNTVELCESLGVQVFRCNKGRAQQLNFGAAKAQGNLLLFLHADTRLPAGYVEEVQALLQYPEVAAGAFRLRIDAKGMGLRLVEKMVDWRCRLFCMPYGDQALFMSRRYFHHLGGFPLQALMEDFELIRRLKRSGKVVVLRSAVSTSARRWQRLGVLRTTAINQMIVLAYLLRVSPERLKRWYTVMN